MRAPYPNSYFSAHFKMMPVDIASYVNKEFLSEVWLFLVRYHRSRVGEATACRRTFIGQYKDASIILLMKGPNSNMLNNHLQ
ncbi:hypothetical protein G6F37_010643 [Rhizopus arrhizus]|nr:hypothetical protein G6F38_010610 [Rhizopus arrhizus]KAG1153124.1 hypothetical protein G6F37_010643 [Rhizopus arrhizus]